MIPWIFSPLQRSHAGGEELNRGSIVPCHECPERADFITAALRDQGFAEPLAPRDHGEQPLLACHDADFVAFLKTAYADWRASGREGSALPFTFPASGGMARRPMTPQNSIFARLGHYCFDVGTPIVGGTWEAAYWSAQTALTGADLLAEGVPLAFALCRPPGHHAGRGYYGGYCFFNNAALAAESLRQAGHAKVAILDVDYHHGNGTQDIFWQRGDVFYGSIHAEPLTDFPYFCGYADETGAGDGAGATLNLPLPRGTDWQGYQPALEQMLAATKAHGATALVVSLGVDTWYGDPISGFALQTEDFAAMGQHLALLGLPTLVVMEGGYAVADVGKNVANVLRGLEP
ncbi:histone deacetylase family protein [Insolitispirillum peregrinum]|uniref:Acetoin utilization deacetylase AcuC n=1 Tax=Insolitispirillum peregrinum TaxID=80876 RepID=A0A1N7JIJ2_9PROT|nr:histone deacetylase family protein [Insolitispirillum peregrinum]SIS49149.1 Acetoin utilization deacetylase AcuC [Insolitispirillum peregrinum]